MGLFFKKKNKKTLNDDVKVYLSAEHSKQHDMVSLIKNEQQQQDIENPFVETAPTVTQKSVAKRYGTKYIGVPGKQIASTIVVDVRSYKKPEPLKEVSKLFDDEDKEPETKKSSFFDEIMKSLDEEDEDFDFGEKEEEPVAQEEPKFEVKKQKKSLGKRKVDIDIISGDFGGADIV